MNPIKVSIGFVEGKAYFSKAIMYLDKIKGVKPVSHTYLRFDFEGGGSLIYESHFSGGVQITPYEHLLSAKLHGKIGRVVEIELDANPVLVWNDCLPLHGNSYDKGQILRYYFWIRFFHRKGRKLLKLHKDGKYTCNEFVVSVCRQTVEKLKTSDYSFTPNKLLKLFTE